MALTTQQHNHPTTTLLATEPIIKTNNRQPTTDNKTMDFLNLAAQAVVLLAILIWTILKALWRLVLFVWQIARDYTPLMARRVGKVLKHVWNFAIRTFQATSSKLQATKQYLDQRRLLNHQPLPSSNLTNYSGDTLQSEHVYHSEPVRQPEFDSGSKVRALFRKLQAAVSKSRLLGNKSQYPIPTVSLRSFMRRGKTQEPASDTPSLSQSNPLLSLQSVPTAPVEDDLFSEAKVQSILALFGSASDSQSVETPADKDLEKPTEKGVDPNTPHSTFHILHSKILSTSMSPFLDKISHRSAKLIRVFIKRLHNIFWRVMSTAMKQAKHLLRHIIRIIRGTTKQSPNPSNFFCLSARKVSRVNPPKIEFLIDLISKDTPKRLPLEQLGQLEIRSIIPSIIHRVPRSFKRSGIIHHLLSIIHISIFRGNKWMASTVILLHIVISWLWQGLTLGVRVIFKSAQTLIFRLFHIAAKAVVIITHPRLPSARERSRIISRVSFSGMVVSAVVLVFLFFPDFVFAVIPYQTEPIQSAVDKSALGGKFTDGNLYAPIHLPEQNEFLPDGNWLVISKTGVMTEIGEAPTEDHEEALKQGVWRVPEFADPTSSQNVPVILVAHKYGYITWSNKFRRQHSFYNLEQLEIGDTFEIIWDHRRFTYEIYAGEEGKEINDYKADVVLYTCKYLNSPARIFRYARRVEW